MKATTNVQSLMPYHGDYGSVVAGSRFLKALQGYTTVCLYMLPSTIICQDVKPFSINHYDLSNSIVA